MRDDSKGVRVGRAIGESVLRIFWLRGGDLNPRPLGYEPNELPDCSTPRHVVSGTTERTMNPMI